MILFTSFFFFNDTATTEIYTLSLHDALPLVDGQVYPGLAGMIQIGDPLRNFKRLDQIKRRTMAFQAVGLGDDGNLINVDAGNDNQITNLINGHYQPTLTIRPGDTQLWDVA